MSIGVDRLLRAYQRRTRMGLGNLSFANRETSPTITEILDSIREWDMKALEALPTLAHTSDTITTVAGTAEYTDIGDGSSVIYNARVRSVLLEETSSATTKTQLRYIDYDESLQRWPNWQAGATDSGLRARPTHWSLLPGGAGTIVLINIPDQVYTVTVLYETLPSLYGLPADTDNFGVDIQLDGRSQVTDDTANGLTTLFADRSRSIRIFVADSDIPGALDSGTHVVTLNGVSLDGRERQETVDISGFTKDVTIGTSTVFYDKLNFVGLPDVSATSPIPTISLGTSATFDTANIGANVAVNSHIVADSWAERLGPVGAAAEYFYGEGETAEGDRLKREFFENLEGFVTAMSRPPQARMTMFDSGFSGVRNNNLQIFHS